MTFPRFILAATAVAAFASSAALAAPALPQYNVDTGKISVSGLSAGGFMANQLGYAFSSTFMGVGVFAPAVLRRELAEGQLRLLGVSGAPLPDLSFTASWRRGRDSHVAAAVARLAVQVAGGAGTDSKF